MSNYYIDNSIALDSSIPDHRILAVDLKMNSLPPHSPVDRGEPAAKLQFKTMPEDYLLDPTVVDRIEALTAELENSTCTNLSTSNLNKVYEEFYTIIDSQLKIKQFRPRDRKRNRNVEKEWWNDNLGSLVKGVRQALRVWEANKANLQLRSDYLHKQKEFSTEL